MGMSERKFLNANYDNKPLFYKRYVDDIFCIFTHDGDVDSFLAFLNAQHPSIQYTMEKECNNKIAFLDTLLDKNHKFKVSVFHKKTYTGLLTNFLSFIPYTYKVNLIKCLIDRIYNINNSWHGVDFDLEEMSQVLQRNCYPASLIDETVRTYLNNKFEGKDNIRTNNEEEKIYFIKLPYIGKLSTLTKSKLNSLCKKLCKTIDIRVIFTSQKISQFFSTKDILPKLYRSMVA